MKICLTEEELAELTDTPFASLQMQWLDEKRWTYEVSRRGKPKVARALFEERMGIRLADPETSAQTRPDWTHDA